VLYSTGCDHVSFRCFISHCRHGTPRCAAHAAWAADWAGRPLPEHRLYGDRDVGIDESVALARDVVTTHPGERFGLATRR